MSDELYAILIDALVTNRQFVGHYNDCDDPEARTLTCFEVDRNNVQAWLRDAYMRDVAVAWVQDAVKTA